MKNIPSNSELLILIFQPQEIPSAIISHIANTIGGYKVLTVNTRIVPTIIKNKTFVYDHTKYGCTNLSSYFSFKVTAHVHHTRDPIK